MGGSPRIRRCHGNTQDLGEGGGPQLVPPPNTERTPKSGRGRCWRAQPGGARGSDEGEQRPPHWGSWASPAPPSADAGSTPKSQHPRVPGGHCLHCPQSLPPEPPTTQVSPRGLWGTPSAPQRGLPGWQGPGRAGGASPGGCSRGGVWGPPGPFLEGSGGLGEPLAWGRTASGNLPLLSLNSPGFPALVPGGPGFPQRCVPSLGVSPALRCPQIPTLLCLPGTGPGWVSHSMTPQMQDPPPPALTQLIPRDGKPCG